MLTVMLYLNFCDDHVAMLLCLLLDVQLKDVLLEPPDDIVDDVVAFFPSFFSCNVACQQA